VPLGAVLALSWCGELSLEGILLILLTPVAVGNVATRVAVLALSWYGELSLGGMRIIILIGNGAIPAVELALLSQRGQLDVVNHHGALTQRPPLY